MDVLNNQSLAGHLNPPAEETLKETLQLLHAYRNMTQDMPEEMKGVNQYIVMIIMLLSVFLALGLPFLRLCWRSKPLDTVDDGSQQQQQQQEREQS